MTQSELNELAERIRESGVPTHFEPEQTKLLIEVWRLLAEGHPVSAEQIRLVASKLEMLAKTALSFLHQLCERDENGNIVGLFGLSQKDHPHKFHVDGKIFSTWCAWDALFLPAMLRKTAKVESTCPRTKENIRLTLTPKHVESYEPADSVLSIIIPKPTKKGLDCVEEVWGAFCCHVHFFRSADDARQWFAGKNQDIELLSIDEGYRLGHLAFKEILRFV